MNVHQEEHDARLPESEKVADIFVHETYLKIASDIL
jgi:hypothetical protein